MKSFLSIMLLFIFILIAGCFSNSDDYYNMDKDTDPDISEWLTAKKLDSLNRLENTYVKCSDQLDNDANGVMNCSDPNCKVFMLCADSVHGNDLVLENTYALCNNNYDDDKDGNIDCNDNSCYEILTSCKEIIPKVDTEDSYELCTDSVDNDKNGLPDCRDPVCKRIISECINPQLGLLVENTIELCTNKVDDDKNGLIDCKDSLETACGGFKWCDGDSSITTGIKSELVGNSKVVTVGGSISSVTKIEAEDFVSKGVCNLMDWPFIETSIIRDDRKDKTPAVSYPDAAADSNGVEFYPISGSEVAVQYLRIPERFSYLLYIQKAGLYSLKVKAAAPKIGALGGPYGITFYFRGFFDRTQSAKVQSAKIVGQTASWTTYAEGNAVDVRITETDTLLMVMEVEGEYNLDYYKLEYKGN